MLSWFIIQERQPCRASPDQTTWIHLQACNSCLSVPDWRSGLTDSVWKTWYIAGGVIDWCCCTKVPECHRLSEAWYDVRNYSFRVGMKCVRLRRSGCVYFVLIASVPWDHSRDRRWERQKHQLLTVCDLVWRRKEEVCAQKIFRYYSDFINCFLFPFSTLYLHSRGDNDTSV